MTDLNRLHTVALYYDWVPRAAGRTTHDCHLVAGLVDLGEPQILCLLPEMRWLSHAYPMLADVLQEHGFDTQRTTIRSLQAGGCEVRFVARERELRGYSRDVPVVVFEGLGLLPEIKFHGLFDDYLGAIEGMIKVMSTEDDFYVTLSAFERVMKGRS